MAQESTRTDARDWGTEEYQRLSQCWLWDFQRAYYENQGINAWSSGTVPSYITSNPLIAKAYAKLILGYLHDCLPHLDHEHPVNIIELGAGSGRLAFHLLKHLTEALAILPFQDHSVRYVMTDFAQQNLDFWQSHPSLQPFVERGTLDFALFDATQDTEILLTESGQVIKQETIRNPIIVIANYFFDSIPQDAFRVENGQLHETLIKASFPNSESTSFNPELLNEVKACYQYNPIDWHYYGDNGLDGILHYYEENLQEATFHFSTTAIETIRNLEELSRGQMLLISGDKGYCYEEDLEGVQNPEIAFHGSLSTMVNYHAIGRYVTEQNGKAFFPGHKDSRLSVATCIIGSSSKAYPETRLAYRDAIENGGPDDFFNIKTAIEAKTENLTLEQIISYLRVSEWETTAFMACYTRLLKLVESTDSDSSQQLRQAITKVWENYYHINEKLDLAYHIGVLLSKINLHSEALEYFQCSLELYGPTAHTYHNIGVCYFGLGQFAEALSYVSKTKELDPDFDASTE